MNSFRWKSPLPTTPCPWLTMSKFLGLWPNFTQKMHGVVAVDSFEWGKQIQTRIIGVSCQCHCSAQLDDLIVLAFVCLCKLIWTHIFEMFSALVWFGWQQHILWAKSSFVNFNFAHNWLFPSFFSGEIIPNDFWTFHTAEEVSRGCLFMAFPTVYLYVRLCDFVGEARVIYTMRAYNFFILSIWSIFSIFRLFPHLHPHSVPCN